MLDTAADWSHNVGSVLAPVFYFRLELLPVGPGGIIGCGINMKMLRLIESPGKERKLRVTGARYK